MTDKKITNLSNSLETMNRIQEKIDKILEPQRQIHETIRTILEPQFQIQEAMRKALEPQLQTQEAMRKALEPQLRMQETIRKALEPKLQMQETIRKALEPQLQMQETIRKYLEPQLQIQEALRKALEPHQNIQKKMAKIIFPIYWANINTPDSIKFYNDSFIKVQKQMNSFNSLLSDSLVSKIEIVQDDKILLEDEILSIDKLIDSYNSFFLNQDINNAFEYFNAFVNWIEPLNRVTKAIVVYVFLPYLISVIATITTPILTENFLHLEQNGTKKNIVEEAKGKYPPDVLKAFRYTSASILYVRSEDNAKSEIIDELKFGTVVYIIEKNKRWCLIEYKDSITGIRSQGWVFSRYLSKFER